LAGSCYNMVMFAIEKLDDHLRNAGLRPTQQRLALARLLFGKGDRHICAEVLHAEAVAADVPVSLATVYNTLNQFKSAGLLRELAIEGDRSYFDTNTSNHFHFFDTETGDLLDLDSDSVSVSGLPPVPHGKEIDRIDVIVRLKDKA
jgi:Fur family transcriptional regulator, iron response regulator